MSETKRAIEVIREAKPASAKHRVLAEWTAQRHQFFQRKYLAERCLGSLLLVFFAPLIAVLWALVKMTSPGTGFYQQQRVGLNGKVFNVFKLRTMVKDAESGDVEVWCQKNDMRVTWLGRILRKLHLDELPQLLNVFLGEMVLVGPRPERPNICKELEQSIEGYYDRVAVTPGITGLSQINLPPDVEFEDVIRKQVLDIHYINETNLGLELRILLATGLRMIGIKGDIVMRLMFLSRRSMLREMGLIDSSNEVTSRRSNSRQLSAAAERAMQLNRESESVQSAKPRLQQPVDHRLGPALVFAEKFDSKPGKAIDPLDQSSSRIRLPR